MTNWLEQIAVTLFLLLGLNVFNLSHAETINSPKEIIKNEVIEVCPAEGQVLLQLVGSVQSGQLVGWVDGNYTYWNVIFGRVTGFINSHYVDLLIEAYGNNEYTLRGWLGTNYIIWYSRNGYFDEWIYC